MVDSLKKFGELVSAVWDTGIFGISLGIISTAIAIFFAFLFARRIFFRFVMSSLLIFTKRTKTTLDDLILETIKKPLEMAVVVLGLYVAGQVLPLHNDIGILFDKLLRSLIALMFFWALFNCINPVSSFMDGSLALIGSPSMRDTMKGFFVKLTKFVVICLGITTVFQEWGFNVAAVLGSLGLIGMAVALGAKDFIANLFAGLTIFLDRMFEKGNWIQTTDIEGVVEDIGFRATTIRRFDKALVVIPNAKLAGDALINFSRMTNRRIYWTIGVEYRTTHEQLRQIIQDIKDYLQKSQDFETDPTRTKTFVFVDAFSASSIDIMLYCFTKTIEWGEWLACKERLAYKIKSIVEGHGTAFAFPSTSLYIETNLFDKPEQFPVPGQLESQRTSTS